MNMKFSKFHCSLWAVLGIILVSYFVASSGHHHAHKKDLQIIHKRSHAVMHSVIDGMRQKINTSIVSNHASSISEYLRSRNAKGKTKDASFLRVCYYRFEDPLPPKLNASLCTHIIMAFADVVNGSLTPSSSKDEKGYILTTNLKKQYPSLKVMLSCGGGGNDKGFSDAVNSFKNRTKFIKSSISLLRKYNFDGLDIDWEFPAWQGAPPEDKPNLVLLLKEFRNFTANLRHYSQNPLLLSVAVGAPKPIIDVSYDIPEMAKYVDFINLMSYDYHDYTWYLPFTGHNSPLFNRSVEHAYFSTLNTAWSANYWFHQGMPMPKIMVGIPMYAHTYTLADPTLHGFDDPATGFGIGNGTMTFPMVCSFLTNGTKVFDKESQVPYAYGGINWIAYDDYQSVKVKAEWVRSQGFGGVMTFDLNCDDWQGTCDGQTKFPLHQIIYNVLTG